MNKAIVTGYSSGIGKDIVRILEENNIVVFKLKSRLEDIKSLEKEINLILKENDINYLINVAGIGNFSPFNEVSLDIIDKLININLKAPIILTRLLINSLKKTKGKIINISSIEATRNSKFSALYSASKSGLRAFSLSLFEEVRKQGISVTNINPDITFSNFFDNLNFKPTKALYPKDISKVVLDVIKSDFVISDITLRSQDIAVSFKK